MRAGFLDSSREAAEPEARVASAGAPAPHRPRAPGERDTTARRAARTAIAVVAAATALRLALADGVVMTSDEAYHWAWAKRLDWGYHEHPPLLAWVMRFFLEVFGDTRIAVRMPSIAASVLLAWALWRFAVDRWKDPVLGARAVALATATPFVLGAGMYASTDMLFVANFTAALWAASGSWRARETLLFGLFAGLALLSKLIGLFLLPGVLLALLFSRERFRLRTPAPWLGVAIALLVFSPFVLWSVSLGWPSLAIRVGHQVGGQGFPGQYVLELVGLSLLAWTPWLLIAAVRGLLALVRRWRGARSLADSVLLFGPALIVLFYVAISFRQRVAFHWIAAGVVPWFLALAGRFAGQPRFLKVAGWASVACTLAVLTFVRFPDAIPSALPWDADAHTRVSTLGAQRRLIGIEEAAARWAEEVRALEAEGRRVFLVGNDYGFLCQAWFEGGLGDVPAMLRGFHPRIGGSFRLWMKADEPRLIGADAVYVKADLRRGGSRNPPSFDAQRDQAVADVAGRFESVEAAPDLLVMQDGTEFRRFFVVRCRGYRGGFAAPRS